MADPAHICSSCGSLFTFSTFEQEIYTAVAPTFRGRRFEIPLPAECPTCRQRLRLSFRNERFLFRKPCAMTGKQVISMYPPESPYKVVGYPAWRSEAWRPEEYGRAYDFSRPFFEQRADLQRDVPRPAVIQQATMENSEYTNRASNDKNCYLIFSSSQNEDCYYGISVNDCKNCVDCLVTQQSELCYECCDCIRCYRSAWLAECENCTESYFLVGCTGCTNCFMCTNLVRQQYCVRNQQLSRAEYERFLHSAGLGSRERLSLLQAEHSCMRGTRRFRSFVGTQNEQVTGNILYSCRDSFECFDSRDLEKCMHVQSVIGAHHCVDLSYFGRGVEYILHTHGCGLNCQRVVFSNECWNGMRDALYCEQCETSNDLFGCIGMRRASHAILNRAYTRHEYETLMERILGQMIETGEWGQYFPRAQLPFPYNETVAQDYFPTTKEKALAEGWFWRDEPEDTPDPAKRVPDTLEAVNASATYSCTATGKEFRFTSPELKFYRALGLAPPSECFEARVRRRLSTRAPRKLIDTTCQDCAAPVRTAYADKAVFCDRCYADRVH